MSEIEKVFAGLDTKLRKFKQAWGAEFTERVQKKHVVNEGAYTSYPGLSGTFAVGGYRPDEVRGYSGRHLREGWGIVYGANDIEIYNVLPYASFVEYGTDKMAPQGQMRSTIMEKDQITIEAKKKVGLP